MLDEGLVVGFVGCLVVWVGAVTVLAVVREVVWIANEVILLHSDLINVVLECRNFGQEKFPEKGLSHAILGIAFINCCRFFAACL